MEEPAKSQSEVGVKERVRAFGALMRRLGPVGPVALISMTLPAVMGITLMGLAKYHEGAVGSFVAQHRTGAIAIYISAFAVLAGLPIMPTIALTMVGGYFLRFETGVIATLTGYTLAVLISYVFLFFLSGDRVEKVVNEHPKWKAVRDELLRRSTWRTLYIIALLRLPPALPFALTNLVIVTSKVPLRLYVAGSVLGVIPRTFAVLYIATTLASLSAAEESSSAKKWISIAGIGVMVVVLVVITRMGKRAIEKFSGPGGAGGGESVAGNAQKSGSSSVD